MLMDQKLNNMYKYVGAFKKIYVKVAHSTFLILLVYVGLCWFDVNTDFMFLIYSVLLRKTNFENRPWFFKECRMFLEGLFGFMLNKIWHGYFLNLFFGLLIKL